MSFAFSWNAEEVRVSREALGGMPKTWKVAMQDRDDGCSLIEVGTDLRPGDIVHRQSFFGWNEKSARRVEEVDWETLAERKRGVVHWVGPGRARTRVRDLDQMGLQLEFHGARLLEWVHDQTEGESAVLLPADGGADQVPAEPLRILIEHLRSVGWIEVLPAPAGQHRVRLTPSGGTTVRRNRDARADRLARVKALRSAMVLWLAEREADGDPPASWEGFSRSLYSAYYGEQFTVDEVVAEAVYLAEKKMVNVAHDQSATGWSMPRLTAEGRDCAMNGGDVTEHGTQATGASITHVTNNITASGAHSPIAAGTTVNQTVNTGVAVEGLVKLAEFVQQVSGTLGLQPAQRDILNGHAAELLSAASAAVPDRTRLHRLADNVKQALLAVATSSTARDIAVTMAEDGIRALGH